MLFERLKGGKVKRGFLPNGPHKIFQPSCSALPLATEGTQEPSFISFSPNHPTFLHKEGFNLNPKPLGPLQGRGLTARPLAQTLR